MLKLSRTTLENAEETHRMEGISFHFPDTGFISIYGDDESLVLQLARLLVGLHRPCSGSMVHREEIMEYFTLQEQRRYRSICTTSLLCDFQLLEQCSVLDNIRIGYDENEQELDNLLGQRGLYNKRETWVEDLDSDDHIRMVLLHIPLHHPRVLVVYPPNSPFFIREWGRMFPLLKKLSVDLLVMIVQDENSYPQSDCVIEFKAGYVISDPCGQEGAYPQQPVSKTQFQL